MPSRIFIISQTESSLTNRGKRHPDLANYLAGNNHELLYISSNYYHAEKRFFSHTEINESAAKIAYSLKIIKIPAYKSNISVARVFSNLIFAYRTQKFLRDKVSGEDVIIIPSRPVEILFFISRLKRRLSFKVILDIRDIWPDAFNISNKFIRGFFSSYCNYFLNRSVKHFDVFIHTCPSFTTWLTRYDPSKKSIFLPLGYDHTRFQGFNRNRTRRNIIHFVYIGLIQFQIDLLPMIKAIEKNDRFSLTIIGDDGTGEKYREVEEYIRVNEIFNVRLFGQIKQELVPEELLNYDIGLLPMKADYVFPNKLFDYIASGLPILSLGENDSSRFVEEYSIGWKSQFDTEQIRSLLGYILNAHEDEIQKASEKLSLISGQFSRVELFKDMLKIVENA